MSGDPTGIPLDIQGELAQRELSGKLTVIAEGLPTGRALSAGTNNGDGTWSLGLDDLSGICFIAPTGQTGGHTLTIRVLRWDTDGSDTAALFDMRVGDGAGGADVAEPSGEAAPAAQAQRRSEEEQLRRDEKAEQSKMDETSAKSVAADQRLTIAKLAAAQAQRRSKAEQLRRDEKAEQSKMDETSAKSVAADQRLTMRLLAQWHKMRGNRRCPLVSEFLSFIPPELLPNCFNFVSGKSLDEGRISLGNNIARISGITKTSLLLAEVPGNTLLGAAIRSLEDALKGNPIPDSREFEDGTGQRYLYRAILLPLEDDEGEIIQVLCGARLAPRPSLSAHLQRSNLLWWE